MTAIAKKQSQVTVSILMFLTFSLPAVSSQTRAVSKTQLRLVRAMDATLTQGRDALLPPHISQLLGISPEQLEVPVKQFAIKAEAVRGFDVSVGDHDIVIFVENPSQKENTFYLTSDRGIVRKVVWVKDGVGYDRAATAADRRAFEKEKQFWLDRLAPETPSPSSKP